MRDSHAIWPKVLSEGFSSARDLLSFLEISQEYASIEAEQQFQTRVPQGFARLMQPGNPHDPLLRQVLAVSSELQSPADYVKDPLEERSKNPVPGLIHKYHGRVLLTITGSCAVNCRYCFRRHFPYADNNPGKAGWEKALNYIKQNTSIHEIILSGGDPLLAKDSLLQHLFEKIADINHVNTVRIHSRLPVVLPERVDASFLSLLQSTPLKIVIVVHANHPNELDGRVEKMGLAFQQAGCHVLNQSVFLAGVNDDINTLIGLSHRLFECHILPYYIHLLDKVQGASHFALPLEQCQRLYQQMQLKLPGYLVPRLVCEIPHVPHKVLAHLRT